MELCIQCGEAIPDVDNWKVIYVVAEDGYLCDETCENKRRIAE